MGLLTICGSVLFNYAYQNYQVSQISILNILFFPLSALVSKVYFGEQLALREWLGNLLILLGVVYFQFF
jgi:drug/metabolite transporter (DMT)-like permease